MQVCAKPDLPNFTKTDSRRLVVVTCKGPVIYNAHGGRTCRDNVLLTAVPETAAKPHVS